MEKHIIIKYSTQQSMSGSYIYLNGNSNKDLTFVSDGYFNKFNIIDNNAIFYDRGLGEVMEDRIIAVYNLDNTTIHIDSEEFDKYYNLKYNGNE